MARTFTNALTGRSVRVQKDTRLERLVEADDNWSEDKPKKEASGGSGNADGRRGSSRKKSDGDGK